MSAASKYFANVGCENSNVSSGRTVDANLGQPLLESGEIEARDCHGLGVSLNFFAAAREPVKRHPIFLHSTVHRGHLLNFTAEVLEHRLDLIAGREHAIKARSFLPLRVEGVRLDAKAYATDVALRVFGDERDQLGRVTDGEGQHAGRLGVEGAHVADSPGAKPLARGIHHVVTRLTGRLVDDQETRGSGFF